MIIRVNLMKEAEFRYQGAVSRSFMLRASLITVFIVGALLLLSAIVHYNSLKQRLAWATERWTKIKPAYENVKAMQAEIGRNKLVITELKGWENSRIAWAPCLRDVSRIVPAAVQLTRLNIFGSLEVKKMPTSPIAPPSGTPKPKGPAEAAPPAPLVRKFLVSIEGRSEDKLADKVSLQLVEDIRQSPPFHSFLESVKLQGLRLETGKETSGRVFNIEAMSFLREMK